MRNAGLEEAQDGIKIARRNINNLRYADDTTLTPNIVRWIIEHYHLTFAGTTEKVYEFKEDQDELV